MLAGVVCTGVCIVVASLNGVVGGLHQGIPLISQSSRHLACMCSLLCPMGIQHGNWTLWDTLYLGPVCIKQPKIENAATIITSLLLTRVYNMRGRVSYSLYSSVRAVCGVHDLC